MPHKNKPACSPEESTVTPSVNDTQSAQHINMLQCRTDNSTDQSSCITQCLFHAAQVHVMSVTDKVSLDVTAPAESPQWQLIKPTTQRSEVKSVVFYLFFDLFLPTLKTYVPIKEDSVLIIQKHILLIFNQIQYDL